jgi:threonine synthase
LAVAEGIIGGGESVVCVLTGHVLKDPGALLAYHRDADPAPAFRNAPIEIDASLSALESQLAHAAASRT